MRLLNNLPILGRTSSIRPTFLPFAFARNASRLSGIHHGLRRSERARPQGSSFGPKREIRQTPTEDKYLSPAERRRARALARQNPITYKIKKGKKDITEPVGPGRRSKQKRYGDVRDPLGGDSLLKKFKTGKLLEDLKEADEPKNGHIQHDDFARQMLAGDVESLMNSRKFAGSKGRAKSQDDRPRDAWRNGSETSGLSGRGGGMFYGEKNFERSNRDGRRRTREDKSYGLNRGKEGNGREDDSSNGGQLAGEDSGEAHTLDRSGHQGADGSERTGRDQRNNGSSPFHARDLRPSQYAHAERRPTEIRDENADNLDDGRKEKARKKYEPPLSIPYTTAASQFLYGTSTVEAALLTSRRKLYKLYIYQGGNRMRQDKDQSLADLAQRKGVEVSFVDEARLPLLNKMSGSRPHNGHVLEASPLPQLPVTALGEVSDEKSWPGFKVTLGHQSAEDLKINGTSEFIMTEPSSHKPFVLLLDEIVDPQNLGAIIRTASFMGVTAVVTSKRGSSPVTPVVLKASSGAAEAMTMLSVDSPVDFVQASKENGWRVYAAVPPKIDASRQQVDMRHLEKGDPLQNDPCILILGSEGEGLSRQLRKAAHCEVSIPNMSGSKVVDSLNVSVATGLLCSAFVRGRTIMQNSGIEDAGALF
ncbi:hypothetical protein N0V93_000484 [Gnomoniopsis smithogilvyi]|uniref:rRNA methyltransferase 1, mitochondrial n=1 Tax=Gnomoniopsis smithogilvyi TaxID=1191159 RepID=A0A9W8Z2A3_9PEZI|nr:hypothetical protein N0V93_000484 [Gnomoniopsis smithogilvyi]